MNLIYNLINLERCDYNQFQNLRDETILKFGFPVGQDSDFDRLQSCWCIYNKYNLHIYLRFTVFSVFHDNHEGSKASIRSSIILRRRMRFLGSRMRSWSQFFVQALFLVLKMMILDFFENSKFFRNFWRRSKCHHEN